MKREERYPEQLRQELELRNVHPQLREILCRELHTPFTARWMLGYVRGGGSMKPEELAEEMLFILEKRDMLRARIIARKTRRFVLWE